MRIKSLGVPYGQARAVDYSVKCGLQIEMRDILKLSDLAELESDVSWRNELGKSEHALFFTQFSVCFAFGQHVLSPPNLLAPQPLHFSRQLGVVDSAYALSRSRRKNSLVTPQSMISHGRTSSRPKARFA